MISVTSANKAHIQSQSLLQAAQKLETAFVSQMLKSAGLGEMKGPYSGGAGETQFASFLRDEQAKAIVQNGGIGLTEPLYTALKAAQDG